MSIEDLPNELLVQILECVSKAPNLGIVSKQFNNIINDIERRVFKNPTKYIEELSPPVYFLLKNRKYHKMIWGKAISKGDLNLIIELSRLGYKPDVDKSMISAVAGGYKDLVEYFIKQGADAWNWGMQQAAKRGYTDLVNFFIEKGATDWKDGMASAAKGGHKDLVEFFLEKDNEEWNAALQEAEVTYRRCGVPSCVGTGPPDLNYGMACATKKGHKDIIDFFIEKGANEWHWGMINAAAGGHENLVEFFIEKYNNGLNVTQGVHLHLLI